MFAPLGWLKGPGARRVYRSIQASGQFDARWYRARYLRRTPWSDALWHYLDHGAQRGFDPSPYFDSSHYVESSTDVQNSGVNPLFHYVEYGHEERRSPVRSPLQTLHHYFPEAAPLQMFVTGPDGPERLTVVVDNNTPHFADISASEFWGVVMTSALANSQQLRVLSRQADFGALAQSAEDARRNVSFPSDKLEIVDARAPGIRESFAMVPRENFLATSWTSALAISSLAPPEKLWSLTESRDGYTITALDTAEAQSRAVALETAGHGAGRRVSVLSGTSSRSATPARIVVIGDTHHRLAYCLTMRRLEDLMFTNAAWVRSLSVAVGGEDVDPISLAESPCVAADLTSDEYDLVINVSAQKIHHPRVLNMIDDTANNQGGLSEWLHEEISAVIARLGAAA